MAEEELEQAAEEPKKKSPTMLIIIAAVGLLLIILIGVVIMMMGSGGNSEESASSQRSSTKGRIDNLTVGPIFPMENFIVNLLSDSGRRYLKVQINLELESEAQMEEMEQKVPLIRDIIIRVLSSKTFDEITTETGKARLKEEIKNDINPRLIDGQVRNVFFTDFVIQ